MTKIVPARKLNSFCDWDFPIKFYIQHVSEILRIILLWLPSHKLFLAENNKNNFLEEEIFPHLLFESLCVFHFFWRSLLDPQLSHTVLGLIYCYGTIFVIKLNQHNNCLLRQIQFSPNTLSSSLTLSDLPRDIHHFRNADFIVLPFVWRVSTYQTW